MNSQNDPTINVIPGSPNSTTTVADLLDEIDELIPGKID